MAKRRLFLYLLGSQQTVTHEGIGQLNPDPLKRQKRLTHYREWCQSNSQHPKVHNDKPKNRQSNK